eukprot:1195455-Prorocentrum_minimum.AAC.1
MTGSAGPGYDIRSAPSKRDADGSPATPRNETQYGDQIDQHECVIRFNAAKTEGAARARSRADEPDTSRPSSRSRLKRQAGAEPTFSLTDPKLSQTYSACPHKLDVSAYAPRSFVSSATFALAGTRRSGGATSKRRRVIAPRIVRVSSACVRARLSPHHLRRSLPCRRAGYEQFVGYKTTFRLLNSVDTMKINRDINEQGITTLRNNDIKVRHKPTQSSACRYQINLEYPRRRQVGLEYPADQCHTD